MPIETMYTYECEICGKKFSDSSRSRAEKKARECEESHDIIYIKLEKADLQRLLAFISTGNKSYMTEKLYRKLNSYRSLT